MLLSALTLIIFVSSTYMVLSTRINDGIVAKHLLSLASISSVLYLLNPVNVRAFIGSILLFAVAISYMMVKHHLRMAKHGQDVQATQR